MSIRICWLAMFGIMAAGTGHAADNACLVESKTEFPASMPADLLADLNAQYGDTRECTEGRGLSEAELEDMCKAFVGAADSLLASMNAKATRKITYLAVCPKPFQGSCDGASGMPFAGFYYKHSAKDLETAKTSCTASGGKWLAGTLK